MTALRDLSVRPVLPRGHDGDRAHQAEKRTQIDAHSETEQTLLLAAEPFE